MNGRRAIVGLCLLCAMAFSAIAAQSAMAVKGTTMFTCIEGISDDAGGQFNNKHCEDNLGGAGKGTEVNGKWGHKTVAQDLTTHAKYVNTTEHTIKTTFAGVPITIHSNSLTGTGSCFNRLTGKEHRIHCENITLKYTGVTVTPETCGVESIPGGLVSTIELKPLTATTQTELMAIKLQPEAGTVIAEWKWLGETCPFGKGTTAKLVGSISCPPDGGTLICNHEEVTTSGTLRFGSPAGPVAGVEGKTTISGGEGKPEDGKPTNPLSATTVETA